MDHYWRRSGATPDQQGSQQHPADEEKAPPTYDKRPALMLRDGHLTKLGASRACGQPTMAADAGPVI